MAPQKDSKLSNQTVVRQFVALSVVFGLLLTVTGLIGIFVSYRSTITLNELTDATLTPVYDFNEILSNLKSLNQDLSQLRSQHLSSTEREDALQSINERVQKIGQEVAAQSKKIKDGLAFEDYFKIWLFDWGKFTNEVQESQVAMRTVNGDVSKIASRLNVLIDKMENINLYVQIDARDVLDNNAKVSTKATMALCLTLFLGALLGTFSIVVIVRNLRVLLKAIADTENKLLQASKLASLGEMSSGVAHEINNPLAIIAASVNLLGKYINNPEKFEAKVAAIRKAADRIAIIVTGLNKFSRSYEGHAEVEARLSGIIKEAVAMAEAKSLRHNTPIRCDLKSEAQIQCDPSEIGQVVVNLVNNAIDAVKEQDERWVTIELSDRGDVVVLRVTDAGRGIPEGIRPKIFDPFFTTKAVGKGTGLGLSIARGILEAHQATIQVLADHPNTCFEIAFQKSKSSVVKSPRAA